MAKLILSEAARACKVARTTIQRAVETRRLSLDGPAGALEQKPTVLNKPIMDRKFKALLAPPRRSCLLHSGVRYYMT